MLGYPTVAPFLSTAEESTQSIAFRAIVLAACLFAVARYGVVNDRRANATLVPLFLFLLAYALRLLENYVDPLIHIQQPASVTFGLLIGSAILPALLLSRGITGISEKSLVLVMTAMCVAFVFGLLLNWESLITSADAGRAGLSKLNPISLASAAAAFVIFLLLVSPTRAIYRLARVVLISVLLVALAYTRSRGPLVGIVAVLLLYSLVSLRTGSRTMIAGVAVVCVAAAVVSFSRGVDIVAVAFERFNIRAEEYDISQLGRLNAWRAAWGQFLESPFLGDRVVEPTLNTYPHNLFLEAAISLGVLGLVLVISIVGVSVAGSLRLLFSRSRTLVEGFVVLLFLKELVQAQFSGAIWGNTTLWVLCACVITLSVVAERRRVVVRNQGVSPALRPHTPRSVDSRASLPGGRA